MPIYRRKPDEVHAEVYRPGLEDGFGYKPRFGGPFALIHDGSGRLVRPNPEQYGELVPLLLTAGGYKQISEGDYIITTTVEGKKDVCPANFFELLYENAE